MSELLKQLFLARLDDMRAMRRQGVGAICEDSTPVLFFGEPGSARTVTIGINPSWHEFYASAHRPLPEAERRFAHESDLLAAPVSGAEIALERMQGYFHGNPFKQWFNWLEALLSGFGDSYYQGTAAHTDVMSCYATDPAWSSLDDEARARVAASGGEALAVVLRHARHAERLIVIGKTAREALARHAGLHFEPVSTELDRLPKMEGWIPALQTATWHTKMRGPLDVIGLTPYLKGTPGAPLSHKELRSVAGLLADQPMRRAS